MMETENQDHSHLSEPRGRVEDIRLITGKGRFVDDLKEKDPAFLGIVRSPYAHARIKRIDFSRARQSPYFIASFTGEDLVKMGVGPLMQNPLQKPVTRYHLAVGKTVFAGEAVAAILSKNRYAVEDLIDEVEVEYEELTPVLNIEDSKKKSALIFEGQWNDNLMMSGEARKGEPEAAFRSAEYTIKEKMGIKRQTATAIEPRAVLAKYDKERDRFEIYATVQGANRLQSYLAQEFKLPKEKFHVIVQDVGGGFGAKGAQSYPENALSCIFAKMTGLSVKWAGTRTEDLVETSQGRDEYCEIELACDKVGKITALRATLEADGGVSGTLSIMPGLTLRLMPGAYKIPNLDLKVSAYVTNKSPMGPMRGAGRPEACFFIERAVDVLSRKSGIDPLELRRKNLIQPEDFPYDNGAGFVYDSGNYPLLLDTLEGSTQFKDSHEAKKSRDPLIRGAGVCIGVEDTGSQFSETARLVFDSAGNLTIFTGSSPHGQGLETSLAQLAARELGIPLERIRVVYGDTDLVPFGVGTFGSRSMVTGGSAVMEAARKLKTDIISKVADALKVDTNSLDFQNGSLVVTSGAQQRILTSRDLLSKLGTDEISSSSEFKMPQSTFASAAHLCLVSLEPESLLIKIERYVVVDDAGRVINRAIVDGQIHGGVIHGLGGALLEELAFDSDGHLLTSNFLDYTIPSALDSPEVEVLHVETPSKITLNGARGVGESGTIGAYPAIFNAINDAISKMGDGFEFNFAPATFDELRSYLLARGKKL